MRSGWAIGRRNPLVDGYGVARFRGHPFFWGDHPESARLGFLKVGPSKIGGFPQYGALKQRQTHFGKKTDQFWGGTPRFCRVEYNRGRRS